jgi:hypothetical protein
MACVQLVYGAAQKGWLGCLAIYLGSIHMTASAWHGEAGPRPTQAVING